MGNWGGIIGSALAGGVAGAGAGVSQVAQLQMKEDAERQRMTWQEAKEIRMKELEQKFKVVDEQRAYTEAGKRAGEISQGADSIIKGQQNAQLDQLYGADAPADKAYSDEEYANIPVSPSDRARAEEQFATSKGYGKEADRARLTMETERKYIADANKDNWQNAMEERKQAYEEARLAALRTSESGASDRAKKAAEADLRKATTEAMKGAQAIHKDKVAELKNLANDINIKPEDMPAIQKNLKQELSVIERELAGYRNALAGHGYEVQPGSSAPRAAPAVGTVISGMKFTGGNPNDQKAWVPVDSTETKPAKTSIVGSSTGSHDEPPPAPRADNRALVSKIADLQERIRDTPMVESAKDRLRLEIADLQRQLGSTGIIASTRSAGR